MTRLATAIVAGAALVVTVPAFAADIYQAPPAAPAAPYVPPSSVFDWNGPYAGALVAYAFGTHEVSSNGDNDNLGGDGFSGGFLAGYNMQFDNIVVGVEGDISLASLSGDGNVGGNDIDADVQGYGTLRVRAGYAFNNLLAYATGGLAATHTRVEINGDSARSTDFGYALGAGLEAAVTDTISVRAEYMYLATGSGDYGGADDEYDAHMVRVGLAYNF